MGADDRLLLSQGLDVAGTQAAAEALFHSDTMAPILKRATRSDGSVRPLEVLVRSTASCDMNRDCNAGRFSVLQLKIV
jgi:hypothetical protein